MGTPRWLDEREARVWDAYRTLRRDLQNAQDRQLQRDSGLSAADYSLLAPLSAAPGGLMRARELCALTGWERSRLSHQVTRMTKRGLVVKEDCPEDARGSMIRLTDAGRAAIEAAAPLHVENVRRYFFDLVTPEELATLDAVFTRMLGALESDSPQ